MADRLILMGVVGRPHGVRGLVHVHSYAAEDLAGYAPLRDELGRQWSLAWKGDGVAELRDGEGVSLADRTAAERLVNLKLYVARDQLPEPDPEDFYLSDLVGLSAVTPEGLPLGLVLQVHDYGAGASLEIEGGGGPVLVPFTRAAVPEIDLEARRVVVLLPEEVLVEDEVEDGP